MGRYEIIGDLARSYHQPSVKYLNKGHLVGRQNQVSFYRGDLGLSESDHRFQSPSPSLPPSPHLHTMEFSPVLYLAFPLRVMIFTPLVLGGMGIRTSTF